MKGSTAGNISLPARQQIARCNPPNCSVQLLPLLGADFKLLGAMGSMGENIAQTFVNLNFNTVIMFDFSKLGIDVNGRTSGKMKVKCPFCHDRRTNKRDKSLSVNLGTGLYHCHYCGTSGKAEDFSNRFKINNTYGYNSGASRVPKSPWSGQVPPPANRVPKKQPTFTSRPIPGTLLVATKAADEVAPKAPFTPPFEVAEGTVTGLLNEAVAPDNPDAARDAALHWLMHDRGIPAQAVAYMKISSSQELMPQTGKKENCICFNYFEENELINTKYRDGRKNFKMITGAELIPYNIDGIAGTPQCIITEGEIDLLSFLAIGRTDVVSVPNGAGSNLTWLDRFVETHFEDKEVIFLAVDADEKGRQLQQELLRRLGLERCRIVNFGEGCKDANEHLLKFGADSLAQALEDAPEVPLEDVYTAHDVSDELLAFFNNGFEQGAPTGLTALDNFITFETKRLCVVTGVPGQGKSEFVDEMVLRLCLHHSWKIGYFSPENVPLVYHLRKLFEKVSGKRFSPQCTGPELYRRVQNFMGNNVCHIIPKADFCVDTVLEKARQLVRRKGIRILVIDPYNRMEHQIPPGMSETQYIDNFLDKLTNFAVLNDCLVILVAHPRKMNRDARTGSPDRPTLYDINGSAAFFNKCDFGLVVERMPDVVHIYVEKVKFRNLGQPGMVPLVFNPTNGRYSLCDENPTAGSPEMRVTNVKFNTDCWLPKEEDQELFWEGNE